MASPLYVGLAATSPDLIHILMGSKWADVTPVLSILAVNGYISSISGYNGNILLVKDKPHWQLIITTINAVANVTLFMIVGRLGLIALALAYVAKNVVLAPLSTGAALHLLNIKPRIYLAQITPSIAAALAMAYAVMLAREHLSGVSSFTSLVLLVPSGAVFYFLAMAVIGRQSMNEMVSLAGHTVRKS
jgi:O-antigen/teichoic acid export membrane protein